MAIVVKANKLLEQYMQTQNLSEPVFFIISASTTFKLLHFKWTMIKHNEHSLKVLQLADLLKVLQVTLAEIIPGKFKKRKKKIRKEENVMTKLLKALLPLIRR